MLEPEGRHLLLDVLRPPPGYEFDRAVGTSYTLDLAALLTAPVAFALIDREGADGAAKVDPVRLLEAVRRNAEKIDIFCQAGLISLPGNYQPIISYTESSVHEVEAPTRGGIFHPKIWVIRYREQDGERTHYRFLCLSRNLTFDRSWDTVLKLEGAGGDVDADGHALADFVAHLPALCLQELPEATVAAVRQLAEELRTVKFEPPPGIDRLRFIPLGLGESWPFANARLDRMLVISPFLTQSCLNRLARKSAGGRDILISRPESFDRIGGRGLDRFANTFVLHTGTEMTEEPDEEAPPAEATAERPGIELRGLHAKLYVADQGWRATVWTGSANATDAAFGPNVEFLVEMEGKKDRCGVDAFIGERKEGLSLSKLLERYQPKSEEPEPESDVDRLERRLDVLRRDLAAYAFTARIEVETERTYAVRLFGRRHRPVAEEVWDGVSVTCRPLTLTSAHGTPVTLDADEIVIEFQELSFEALTSFFAFELSAREGVASLAVAFLVNAKLIGAPADRRERILVNLLKNRSDLMRFLLFLLGGDGGEGRLTEIGPNLIRGLLEESDGKRDTSWQNLFEPMVRALAYDPSKLDDIHRLVTDLQQTEEGRELLPRDWESIWGPIWDVREHMTSK